MQASKHTFFKHWSCGALVLFLGLQTSWAADGVWYLSRNQMTLNSTNRYYATLSVVNESAEPVFIRSSVDRLALVKGERKRTPDTEQSLTISPEEFVLPPKKSVELRVFAKPTLQSVASQSYYVNLIDASATRADTSGAHTGFLLSYDFLVSVAPVIEPPLKPEDFSVQALPLRGTYRVHNQSGRHIFMGDSYICGNTTQVLVECSKINDFPKQSLLPDESLNFKSAADMKVLGFLMYDDLNMNGQQRPFRRPVMPIPESPTAISR